MTPIGLSKIDDSIKSEIFDMNNKAVIKKTNEFKIPDFIINEFAKNEPALINFNKLAFSHKKQYIIWITNAKRQEVKLKRIKESIGLLKENKKLGLK